jgi:asparagine synthase (glutamine-hydrolysing)
MCGIAGVLNVNQAPADPALLRRMTGTLAHRGPDGEGFFLDGPVALGHRRLAIIDLAAGAQPMSSADEHLWISYNGELYNFRELRTELVGLGYSFRTSSDTEVLLTAYAAWGVECLSRLRGMFAFAIWDRRERQIFLARDRAGIKPLVYAWDGRTLRFASELKALVEDPGLRRELDHDALGEYFTYLYVPSPRTIFRDIKKLPPASYLVCRLDGGAPVVRRYWDLRITPDPRLSVAEWTRSVDEALHEAVGAHLVSDVPVGAFLSGGVDSSSVVACMARVSTTAVKTFSIGFDETAFDELRYAREVAAQYGTEHFEMVLKPDVVDVLPRLTWQLDEPFADASAVPTYCVAKITRDHVIVALSGDGGDENFAGYQRYAEASAVHRWIDSLPMSTLKPLLRTLGRLRRPGAKGKRYLQALGMSPLERYHRMMTYQDGAGLAGLLESDVAPSTDARVTAELFGRLAAEGGTEDYVSTLQYLDVRHYLPEDILTKVDRTTMLASLEARVPLLDHVFMEHAARIPAHLKLHEGVGKYILKRAMQPYLPKAIVSRRKMGFGVPLARWFRRDLREFTQDILRGSLTRQRGILRTAAVDRLLDEHLRGVRDHSAQLWSVLCFELWCRTWWRR